MKNNKEEILNKIIAFENGELSEDEIIEFFKELYQKNILFGLQGTYQRTFNNLCESGLINLEELQAEKNI